ncbi:hypothetical protein CH92_11500 [Stutzerimonas stutzeri]|uniref:Uncharacterized protein n=1 Tax=Stutzerimonas stutzeri TaxID=316 RepID=W8R3Z8_STUST|nr:hypothetical protein CH92_11500 [Stutzerimonas stutzeri]
MRTELEARSSKLEAEHSAHAEENRISAESGNHAALPNAGIAANCPFRFRFAASGFKRATGFRL